MTEAGNIFSGSTSANFFKKIRTLHYAILSGVLVPACIIYYLARSSEHMPRPVFSIAGPLAGLLTIVAAYIIPRRLIDKVLQSPSLGEKLSAWYSAHILKIALLEGGAMFNLVCFFLSGDLTLLIFVGLATIVMVLNTPGPFRVGTSLRLNEAEQKCLETPGCIIP
jgi:hypothetical protein